MASRHISSAFRVDDHLFIGDRVFADKNLTEDCLKATQMIIRPNKKLKAASKKHYAFINKCGLYEKFMAGDKIITVHNEHFPDGRMRSYVEPQKFIFSEDDRPEVPMLVYQVEENTIMKNVAFVMYRNGNPIKDTFVNLQVGQIKLKQGIELDCNLTLTASSELMQSTRQKLELSDNVHGSDSEDDLDDINLELYYTQKYQACIFENTHGVVQIYEIAVKYIP